MAITLYYFPFFAKNFKEAPLFFYCPNPEWEEFSEEVGRQYSKCRFYIEVGTKEEMKQSAENLKVQLKEFYIATN